jgi:hypothetical protein
VKSFKKCGISNVLDGTEDDALFEGSEVQSVASVMSVMVVTKMFWGFVTTKNLMLYCHLFSKYSGIRVSNEIKLSSTKFAFFHKICLMKPMCILCFE